MREKVKIVCLQIDCIGDLHHLLPKYRNCKTIWFGFAGLGMKILTF